MQATTARPAGQSTAAAALVAGLAAIRARRRGGADHYAEALAATFSVAVIAGNVILAGGDPVAIAVHGTPAVTMLACWHLLLRMRSAPAPVAVEEDVAETSALPEPAMGVPGRVPAEGQRNRPPREVARRLVARHGQDATADMLRSRACPGVMPPGCWRRPGASIWPMPGRPPAQMLKEVDHDERQGPAPAAAAHRGRGTRHRGAARGAAGPGAPRVLSEREARRYLHAVESTRHPRDGAGPRELAVLRDQVVALVPYYAGLRGDEVARLDVDDVHVSRRKGELRVPGKGGKARAVPIHAALRPFLQEWVERRPDWPGAEQARTLVLNPNDGRLNDRSVRAIIGRFGELAGLDEDLGAHILRHTFVTQLARAGVALATIAELVGHARRPRAVGWQAVNCTRTDRERAIDALLTDR